MTRLLTNSVTEPRGNRSGALCCRVARARGCSLTRPEARRWSSYAQGLLPITGEGALWLVISKRKLQNSQCLGRLADVVVSATASVLPEKAGGWGRLVGFLENVKIGCRFSFAVLHLMGAKLVQSGTKWLGGFAELCLDLAFGEIPWFNFTKVFTSVQKLGNPG